MNVVEAIYNPNLFRPYFKDLSSWSSWITLLKVLSNVPLSDLELALYQSCTARETPPEGFIKELWCVTGRRSGKSFVSAIVAVFTGLFVDFSKYLSKGEPGIIQVVASDKAQAGVVLKYVKGILRDSPIFSQYVVSELAESVELSTGIVIEVMPCSYRGIRGRTVVMGILDELSFWRAEGQNPDREVLAALRPSMATVPSSRLLVISSPYARYGLLYETVHEYFGKPTPDILIWKSDTRTMNPLISEEFIKREAAKDASAARSEWYGEFREDLEQFLDRTAIEACCVLPGPLAPRSGVGYRGFVDSSSGRGDAFTLSVGHREGEKIVVDLLKAWDPPFNPQQVTGEAAEILRQYRLDKVTGDRFSGGWIFSEFAKHHIDYQLCEKNRSELYLTLEPFVNTALIELPQDDRLIKELCGLERKRGKAGKDQIDHGRLGSDDRANSVAGLCYEGLKAEHLLFPLLRTGDTWKQEHIGL
jgi:hypothetical protein